MSNTPDKPAPNYDHLQVMCRPDTAPDRYRFRAFASLREKWVEIDKVAHSYHTGEPMLDEEGNPRKRTMTLLADCLGVSKQAVSQWATGSGDKSPPPWHIIMWLCDQVGLQIVVRPDDMYLQEQTPKK